MMIKKGDHSAGVSDGIKKFLMKNLIKNLKNSALSCLKKVPSQENTLSRS